MGKYLILSGFLLVVMGIIWIAAEQYGYKNPLDLRWEKGLSLIHI